MPIYTRTGDRGETSLFGGKRVLKCEELVDVYGSIDELNSWIGLVASQIKSPDVKKFLIEIQKDLFTLGSTLAGWKGDLAVVKKRVGEMEERIDALEEELPELRNFIVPGGAELGAITHVARGICRRVERQAVALDVRKVREVQEVRKEEITLIIQYLNRLSDLLFMLARFINKLAGVKEETWSGIKKD